MNTEIFTGTPDALQARLVAILAGASTTINQVVRLSGGTYLIIHS